ncbi:MAG: hypothetical protein LBF59_02475 [Prevotellaceae bacterium]|nr:hypothetical protein [Prevotellaceae bacterium]
MNRYFLSAIVPVIARSNPELVSCFPDCFTSFAMTLFVSNVLTDYI